MSPPIAAQGYWQMGRRLPVMRPVADYLGVSYAPTTLDVLITKQAPSSDVAFCGVVACRGIAHEIHKIRNNYAIKSIMPSPKDLKTRFTDYIILYHFNSLDLYIVIIVPFSQDPQF